MRKKIIVATAVVIVALPVAAWFFRKPLLARHYIAQLASSPAEATFDRIADLGEAATPSVIELFQGDEPKCQNGAKALLRIMDRWPQDDPRAASVARGFAVSAPGFSSAGKLAALSVADALLARGGDCREPASDLIRAALKDDQVSTQVKAIILALKPEFGLAADVAPLIRDPKPEVRRAAMLGVGPLRDIVPDDDILPGLHDSDAEVRSLCESALRSRGLREKDVMLGKLITDSSPLKRMEVIRFLPNDSQLDPETWLNRLCQDSSPIVRASAARVAMDPGSGLDVDMSRRVRQMAQADPDGTVRQIAEFLLRVRETRNDRARNP